jgi:chromosomal replication initiator protein
MPDTIWVDAQRRLRGELLDKDYDTWIVPLRAARWSAGTLTLEAPSGFARDWLKQHFLPALERAVSAASGGKASVVVLVNRALDIPARGVPRPALRAERPAGPPARYTFDNFVVGESNRVAYGAARAVVAQPGARFNPLFLYGGCGLGKTHLLSAVTHGLAHDRPLGAVECLTAENFLNEMIDALKARRMDRFRRRFRGIQTLVIDDIQFLAEKQRSQEEFGHTFNALHQAARQIVIASDRAPHDLPGIGEPLRDRFASGLLAHIDPPDAALRLALVERKAGALRIRLGADVTRHLAEEWCTNVRELEGALTRVEAYASLSGRAIDLKLVREALGPSPIARRGPSLQRIITEVCQHCRVSRDELVSPRRTARVAEARHLAMYLCRHHTEVPLGKIGAEMGGRDHSTVVHALASIERRLAHDAALRETVSVLRSRLGA